VTKRFERMAKMHADMRSGGIIGGGYQGTGDDPFVCAGAGCAGLALGLIGAVCVLWLWAALIG